MDAENRPVVLPDSVANISVASFLKLLVCPKFLKNHDAQFYFAQENIVCSFKTFETEQFYVDLPKTKSVLNDDLADLKLAQESFLEFILKKNNIFLFFYKFYLIFLNDLNDF